MFRIWIAELLTILLALSVPGPLCARHAAQEKAPTIQEQVVQMPAGSVVEVKTQAKQKLRGRLGAVATESFELQTAAEGTVKTQSLRFDQVKSIKAVQAKKSMSTGEKVAWGVLIGLGVLAVLAVVTLGRYLNN